MAERFEVYFKGIELANGFRELTDGREQQQRFEQDNRKRAERGSPQQPIDYNLLAALQHGMPECSGVALGVDRPGDAGAGRREPERRVGLPGRDRLTFQAVRKKKGRHLPALFLSREPLTGPRRRAWCSAPA